MLSRRQGVPQPSLAAFGTAPLNHASLALPPQQLSPTTAGPLKPPQAGDITASPAGRHRPLFSFCLQENEQLSGLTTLRNC